MKKAVLAMVLFFSLASSTAWPATWAIVANCNDRTIHTINLGTHSPAVHGPFLSGQLGGSGSLLDVEVVPNGPYALVSNYELNSIYRLNLSNPENPAQAGFVNIGFPPEDIAIAPNGQFALVSDGVNGNKIAIIDLSTFTLSAVYTLGTSDARAHAIAIAPDNQTAIICDADNDRIIYGILNPASGLTSEDTLPTGFGPINVSISPDGQTVLVANSDDDRVSVFRIAGPGTVVAGISPFVSGIPDYPQSISFSPSGQRAYVVSTGPAPDQLSWLQINGPGNVTLGAAGAVNLLSDGEATLYGADVLAITPDGAYALVGNPFSTSGTKSNNVAWVNLNTWTMNPININSDFPVGIAVFNDFLPQISQFTAVPSTINPGEKVTLSWEVSGADSLSIDNGIGSVTPVNLGSITVSPAGNTTYNLTAYNAYGAVTIQVLVNVVPLVSLPLFDKWGKVVLFLLLLISLILMEAKWKRKLL